jgi:AhpD family alkylhydroperoxidase
MAQDTHVLEELREPTRSLRRAIPDAWAGFASLHEAAMAAGEVPARLKEAVALAISVVKRCDGCIERHARAAARAGCTPGEIAEVLSVALLMDGGPATMYGPLAWRAFHEAREASGSGGGPMTIVPLGART